MTQKTQSKEIFVETDLTDFKNMDAFEQFKTNIGVKSKQIKETKFKTKYEMTLEDNTTVTLGHVPKESKFEGSNNVQAGHIHIKSNDMGKVLHIKKELYKQTSYRKGEDYDGWFHELSA